MSETQCEVPTGMGKAIKDLSKARQVSAHTRQLASGRIAQVTQHVDKREAAKPKTVGDSYGNLRKLAYSQAALESELRERAEQISAKNPQRSTSQAMCQAAAELAVQFEGEWAALDDACRLGDYTDADLYDKLEGDGIGWGEWLVDLSGSRTLILDTDEARAAKERPFAKALFADPFPAGSKRLRKCITLARECLLRKSLDGSEPDAEEIKVMARRLYKAHVKAHTRRTKAGAVVPVKEHEDKREGAPTLTKKEYLALQHEHNSRAGAPMWGHATPDGHYDNLTSAEAKIKAGAHNPLERKPAKDSGPTIAKPTAADEKEFVEKARAWAKAGIPEREIMAALRDMFGEQKAKELRALAG